MIDRHAYITDTLYLADFVLEDLVAQKPNRALGHDLESVGTVTVPKRQQAFLMVNRAHALHDRALRFTRLHKKKKKKSSQQWVTAGGGMLVDGWQAGEVLA